MENKTEEVLINIIELASELANEKLIANWSTIQIFESETDGITTYTEKAQDIFNDYYDDYLMLIKSCEV